MRELGSKADGIVIDDHFGIPPQSWDAAKKINAHRIPSDYKGGGDQWLRDELQKTFEQMSQSAKQGAHQAENKTSIVLSITGWMDHARRSGVDPEALIKKNAIDALDVQVYSETPYQLKLALNRIHKDIIANTELYQELDYISLSVAGRVNGKVLSVDEKEQILEIVHNFKNEMKLANINIKHGIFDAEKFLTGSYK
jgi:hypothetical protein